MLIFVSLLCFSNIIPQKFHNLAFQAREKMKTRAAKSDREPIYPRGHYNYTGIDFFLSVNLMGSTSRGIKGFALEKSETRQVIKSVKTSNDNQQKKVQNITTGYLAIIPNRKKALSDEAPIKVGDAAFVDPTDKTIFKLKSLIADDGVVQIYSIRNIEQLRVFRNLHMFSANPSKGNNKDTTNDEEEEGSNENTGVTIGFTKEDPTTGLSTCFAGYRYYWEKPETGADAFETGPIDKNFIIFSARAGAYAQIFSSFDLRVEDDDFRLEADLELSVMAGLGFSLFPDNAPDDIEIPEYIYPLYGLNSPKMYGIQFELGLFAFGRIVFKDIRYKLIELLRYDYRVKLGVKTHLSYTQSKGLQMDKVQPFHEIMDEKQSPEKITEEMLNEMFLEITPSFQVGLKLTAAAQAGPLADVGLTVRAFLSYDVPFRFRFNSDSCTFPFLSGNYQNQLNFNFAIEGTLKLLKFINEELNYDWPIEIYHATPSGEFCFFDSQKSIDAKFNKNNKYPAYIIEPKTIRLCDDCSQNGDGAPNGFFLNLDYRANGVNPITKSFSFPFVPLKDSSDRFTCNRVFIVEGVTSSSKLQYRGYEADQYMNDLLKNFEQFSIMNFPSGGEEICGDDDTFFSKTGVCIKTFISKAQQVPKNVEIAKPSDSNYISYSSWMGQDVYLGLITHSDGSPYVSRFEDFDVFDDTILDSTQKMKGEIRGNNPVELTIESLNIGNSRLLKLNCEIKVCEGSNCQTILSKAYEKLAVNIDLPDFAPVIQLGRNLDTSNKKIQIKLTGQNDDQYFFVSEEITYKQIYERGIVPISFSISGTSDIAYSFTLNLNIYLSNYVFDVKNLKANSNAMIARIVSASDVQKNNWGEIHVSVFLQKDELYGTLRFFLDLNDKLYDKIPQAKRPPIACVVKMPGLQPLCENVHRLDEDEYVIIVEAGNTLFSMKNSIFWNKDWHSVNIPYRRTDDGSTNKKVTATLYASFTISEDKNPFCSATKPYIGYTTKSLTCGCIKKFTEDKNTEMLVTVKRVDSFTREEFTIKNDIISDKWMIRAVYYTATVDYPYRFEAYFRDKLIKIPSNQASLVFSARQARDIKSTPIHNILFSQDNQIQVTHPNGKIEILDKANNFDDCYEFNIPSIDDYTFTKICNSRNEAHCKTTISLSSSTILSDDDVYLIEYDDIGYLIDYDNDRTGNKLVNNMNRQVVYNRKQISFSKSWIGGISSKSISGASKLTIRASKVGNQIRIEAFVTIGGSEVNIPFSAEKWMNDVDTLLSALKITEPNDGYTLDVIKMDKSGVLMIPGSLYQAGAIIDDYSLVVDYPISYSLECETDYPQFDQVSYSSNEVCFYTTNMNSCPDGVLPLSPSEYSYYLSTADIYGGDTFTIHVGENIHLDSFILDDNNFDIIFITNNMASISGSCEFLAKGTSLSFSQVDISNLDLKTNLFFQYTDALVSINGVLKSFTILIEPNPIESNLEGQHLVLKGGCVFGEDAFPITIEPASMTISGYKYSFSTSCHHESGVLMLDVKKEDKPNPEESNSSGKDPSKLASNYFTYNENDTYVNISFNETIPDDDDDDNSNSRKGNGLSAGGIAGIVIAVLVVVAAAVGVAVFIIIKRRNNYNSTDSGVQETNQEEF